jgi:hypothetical protein
MSIVDQAALIKLQSALTGLQAEARRDALDALQHLFGNALASLIGNLEMVVEGEVPADEVTGDCLGAARNANTVLTALRAM